MSISQCTKISDNFAIFHVLAFHLKSSQLHALVCLQKWITFLCPSIYAVSSAFEGQSAVNRQRMVYKAIWEELQTTVHAVDHMITRTPTEAGLDN